MQQKSPAANEVINIAIADDHALIRVAICSLIKSFQNFQVVIEAENGRELIDSMEGFLPFPDIILLDIGMPVLNGYDTLIEIKKKWPLQKVIILSLIDDEYAVIRTLKNGVNGFLLPPSVVFIIATVSGLYQGSMEPTPIS